MYFLIILIFSLNQNMVHAQDSSVEDEPEKDLISNAEDDSEENIEDITQDIDGNYTEEDEDVFKPSDEVLYSQQIRFPVDI
tara:strand:- start:520 stop:762 length:243 start_codon:yes stop_codon:yes gene_type:complete